jgi:hypothetical protein
MFAVRTDGRTEEKNVVDNSSLVPTVGEPRMRPSAHPESCRGCRGCGFVDGPDEWEIVYGKRHRYTTMLPCNREWRYDEPLYPDPEAP